MGSRKVGERGGRWEREGEGGWEGSCSKKGSLSPSSCAESLAVQPWPSDPAFLVGRAVKMGTMMPLSNIVRVKSGDK